MPRTRKVLGRRGLSRYIFSSIFPVLLIFKNDVTGIPGKCLSTEERCYTPDQPGCGSCCRKFYKDQDGKCLACPQGGHPWSFLSVLLYFLLKLTSPMISGNYTLIFIIIILLLVVGISLMQSFESPALVSSFKGLLTVMSFVQSFVSLRVFLFMHSFKIM